MNGDWNNKKQSRNGGARKGFQTHQRLNNPSLIGAPKCRDGTGIGGSKLRSRYFGNVIGCFILGMALMSVLGGCTRSHDGESKVADGGQEAEATPSPVVFEGMDLEGNVISSDIFSETKLTMVNVWATYCNPCLSEMPGLGELAGEYDSEEFRLIGIISDVPEGADEDALELAAGLVERTGADYTHLLLNQSLYSALLTEVSAVPTTFFIDEKGEVLETVIGAMNKSAWKDKIDGFLEE